MAATTATARQEYDIAVVMSGPEPQRTILENKLMEQALTMSENFLFVQGKPAKKTHHIEADNIEVVSYLTTEELQNALNSAELVVCRSGYSSLMDLVHLQKKAIIIPTPGQTEQEYLARHFEKMGGFVVQNQRDLNLKKAVEKIRQADFRPVDFPKNDFLGEILDGWLTEIDHR